MRFYRGCSFLCVLSLFLLLSLLSSCSSSGGSASATNDNVPLTEDEGELPIVNGLLPGDDGDLAITRIISHDDSRGVADADVGIAADGRHVALTQLEIWLEDDATVGSVNQALQAIGAKIISLVPNVPILLVVVDRPADLNGLQAIADQLVASPAIKQVDFVSMKSADSLPLNHGYLDIAGLNQIYQLIATRNLAARNAKDALSSTLSQPPTIIVADYFGGGVPGERFDIVTDITDYSDQRPDDHGYHVLGIISALDGGSSLVTGAYPDTSFIKAVDLWVSPTATLSSSETENKILRTILDYPKNYVVNTSLGTECGDPGGPCSDDILKGYALRFITKVRNAGIESHFLHVISAGNTDGGFVYAYQNDGINYAALRSDIVDDEGHAVAPLSNVITVENVIVEAASADFPSVPRCLSAGSVSGGHISAPGYLITSFVDAIGTESDLSGTSMAAPMVTATAAYLWALDPSLSPQEIKQRLMNTAKGVGLSMEAGCSTAEAQPFIDVYSAILTVDDSSALDSFNPAAGRVRGTILDVADSSGFEGSNGQFDEKDIEYFLMLYDDADIADRLDYSRYDLNGDGYTNGQGYMPGNPFDLDMDQMIESQAAQISDLDRDFAENHPSDMDILCYYAYSNLYTGDTDQRNQIIGMQCGREDCIYSTFESSGVTYFQKNCKPNEMTVLETQQSIGFGLTIERRVCSVPTGYYIDHIGSCSDAEELQFVHMGYHTTLGVPTYIWIFRLNGEYVHMAYECDEYGRLYDDSDYSHTRIGEYGSQEACGAVLMNYIPDTPSDFEYPGTCSAWWNHDGISCGY